LYGLIYNPGEATGGLEVWSEARCLFAFSHAWNSPQLPAAPPAARKFARLPVRCKKKIKSGTLFTLFHEGKKEQKKTPRLCFLLKYFVYSHL